MASMVACVGAIVPIARVIVLDEPIIVINSLVVIFAYKISCIALSSSVSGS